MNDIKTVIKEEIKHVCFREVDDSELLLDSGMLDSITAVDLAVALEQKLNIKIPFTDIDREHFNTVDSLCSYIEKRMADIEKPMAEN